ncbi:MAG: glyoxylate/hydroxypyruvate reductase A [Ferrovibrio sp.]|uniref:2-hydroxyacid dehydrogenase n=1 Tax=Ferrovibrio sp. TaxID=1917215 RepID=UPI00260B5A21|nr:glyoxylate/hydroxypyruvate reductase A [Ferrovibrio sp.]MCW0235686.1 glyoxylate/hydroxypyruvate reductase A [Ferrovibrio sp.]
MTRDVLLVKSGGEAALPEWRALFQSAAPQWDIRWWDDPAVDPDAVVYALVWQPEAGRLARYPNLRAIFSSAAGVDHIVDDPMLPNHVPVYRMVVEQTAQTVAEYVCLHALAWLRDFARMRRAQAERRWDAFEAPRLASQTRVGIMGLGTIGQLCGSMLLALGFQVHGWARTPKSVPGISCHVGLGGLQPFLEQSDLLVGLVPDTPQTRGLVNADTIWHLPKGAAIINVARGPLVVLDDLIAALNSGHLSAAVLDVFDIEPLPSDHPIWSHPKVTVTAHIAGFASRRARVQKVVDLVDAIERGEVRIAYDRTRGY